MKTLLFSSREIARIVHSVGFDSLMDMTIDGITEACRSFDPSAHSIPVRSGFSYDGAGGKGLVEWMPIIRYGDRVVVKLVGYHPENPQQFRLPTVMSTIVTFDTRTGNASSLVDATFITSLRTGAASAVASAVLASPDASVLGLIGAGAQSLTQLHALSRKFDLKKVLVHDSDLAASNSFARRAAYAGLSLPIAVTSVPEILASSDIICTSTSVEVGGGPLFDDSDIKEPVHINAVGSDFPGKLELPLALLRRSLVCPDFLPQAVSEGECQQLEPHEIGPDLEALVKDSDSFSTYRDTTTVFDSTGWALEDLVAADIIVSTGERLGLGEAIDLACCGGDPKNPYGFVDNFDFSGEQPAGAKTHRG